MDLQTDSALRQKYPANVEGSPEFNRACEADRLFDQFCAESGLNEDALRSNAWGRSGMVGYTEWLLKSYETRDTPNQWKVETEKLLEGGFYGRACARFINKVQSLKEELEKCNEVLESKRKLCREIDVILFGEEDAARSPSAGDILKSVQQLVKENAELRKKNEWLINRR